MARTAVPRPSRATPRDGRAHERASGSEHGDAAALAAEAVGHLLARADPVARSCRRPRRRSCRSPVRARRPPPTHRADLMEPVLGLPAVEVAGQRDLVRTRVAQPELDHHPRGRRRRRTGGRGRLQDVPGDHGSEGEAAGQRVGGAEGECPWRPQPAARGRERLPHGIGRGATRRMTAGATSIAGNRRIGPSAVPITARYAVTPCVHRA